MSWTEPADAEGGIRSHDIDGDLISIGAEDNIELIAFERCIFFGELEPRPVTLLPRTLALFFALPPALALVVLAADMTWGGGHPPLSAVVLSWAIYPTLIGYQRWRY
jgi:hypothetical protein